MNLLLAIFLIFFEALYEGLKTRGLHIASEIVELVYLTIITLIIFAWINRKYIFKEVYLKSFLKVLIGYILLRFALFDLVWNLSAGQDWDYYGTTKFYDRVMTSLGTWGLMWKCIAGIWGIAFLTKWGNK